MFVLFKSYSGTLNVWNNWNGWNATSAARSKEC
jgi:hypothetical protein